MVQPFGRLVQHKVRLVIEIIERSIVSENKRIKHSVQRVYIPVGIVIVEGDDTTGYFVRGRAVEVQGGLPGGDLAVIGLGDFIYAGKHI